jgi:asparagine synthase (glutamine-hydrolysing)
MEKGLLREAFKDLLPEEIVYRKKNPYPKTHHPEYTNIVCGLLNERLKNKKSILYKVFDMNKIYELIDSKGYSFNVPWFGQLMTGPQLIAYLYQFDVWAKEYKVILKV